MEKAKIAQVIDELNGPEFTMEFPFTIEQVASNRVRIKLMGDLPLPEFGCENEREVMAAYGMNPEQMAEVTQSIVNAGMTAFLQKLVKVKVG